MSAVATKEKRVSNRKSPGWGEDIDQVAATVVGTDATPVALDIPESEEDERLADAAAPSPNKDDGDPALQLRPSGPLHIERGDVKVRELQLVQPTHAWKYILDQLKAGYPIFNPIIVVEVEPNEDGERYRILAGRHRAWAASEHMLEELPAVFVDDDTPETVAQAITLIENHSRNVNPVAEYEAIMSLKAAKITEKEISRITGIKSGTITRRLRLRRLVPEALGLWKNEKMTIAVAEGMAKLPSVRQHDVVSAFEGRYDEDPDARITWNHVEQEKQANRSGVAAAVLPVEIFSALADPDAKRQDALRLVHQAMELLKGTDSQALRFLKSAATCLDKEG